jgi:phosphoenolpyruvate carboxykinase (GTP)
VLYKVLTSPCEVIFSNVLVKDGKPYWLGMGCELPKDGINYTGYWWEGKKTRMASLYRQPTKTPATQ